ncbi:MAG: ATP-binding protein, partial [Prevotellaceae bacterium]|nr:ATP-binding protein [Prevotellaceae bacterium]
GIMEKIGIKKRTKLTLLGHIEKIVEMSGDSKLSNELFVKAKTHINFVKRSLHLDDIQTILFANFVDRAQDNQILISEIADFIKCRSIKILQYMANIEALEKRRLIRCSHGDRRMSFRVPKEVLDALLQNKAYQPNRKTGLVIEDFFVELAKLFDERNDNELTYEALEAEILSLLEDNQHLEFTKRLNAYSLDTDDRTLFLLFCHLFVTNNDDYIGFHDFENLFDSKGLFRGHKNSLFEKHHELILNGLVETTNNDGFEDRESFKLTNKAKDELLGELNLKSSQTKHKKNLILHNSLKAKQMYYNDSERRQVEQLASLLQEENFKNVRNRLIEKGMRTGFACLFHGAPGTGKTETVYQIARETGRDIMLVDISQTKSMWFGESEKKIKEIFDCYRACVKESKIAPILLFNEADAVINKRQELGSNPVGKTENAIQNIILQEMENLEGIMIATTNLTQNLDKAFERRFLYKIEFSKPSVEAKKTIWQSIIPALSEKEAVTLSEKYNFSGGQIENIARKCTVDSIIGGQEPDFEKLKFHCQNELLGKNYKPIGFH